MVESGHCTRFSFETAARARLKHLDRYMTVKARITCEINIAHASPTDTVDQFVRSQALS
jgi:hypothetical protein